MSIARLMQMAAAGNVAGGDYQISRSLRFNSADSAYLSRTPASAGNRKTWTWSAWVKRSALGGETIFAAGDGSASNRAAIDFDSGQFRVIFGDGANVIPTTSVFRDPSAWYHFVVAIDTTQATDSNRVKIYVNGSQITALSSPTYPAQNYDTFVNATNQHVLGARFRTSVDGYFNGYLTETYLIDGQALTPSSFGEVNAVTGVWSPKRYAGSYGTNGFHLDFSDNTSTTTLGYDAAGSNDWTLNNFSVTAGAGNDSLVDSPTRYGTDTGAGGEVRGNYCTWNPLSNGAGTISDGNLRFAGTNSGFTRGNSTIAVSSGKWYFEVTLTTASSDTNIGIGQGFFTSQFPGQDALSYVQVLESGEKQTNGNKLAYGTSLTSGDVFMCAFDLDNNKIFFGKNGTWFDSSDPAAGTSPAYSLTSGTYCPIARPYSSSAVTDANFGQRPFAYTAPSGFKALCTTNLPDPTVVQGDDYFNTVLYTGTGSSQSITGVGFQPDMVWIKSRSSAYNNNITDAVRGIARGLYTNNTDAEVYVDNTYFVKAFNTDGFSVENGVAANASGSTYVAWNWKANGAGVSNTAGTITSTVSANTTAGISIVTYTGTGSAATVGHGLGAVPRMIIVKNRDQADAWQVYHAANTANPETDYLVLNTTAATADAADRWNDTLPTSTVFSIGNGVEVNTNTEDYVAYCFAEVEGFSKFGSYTGNGSTDGPFVYTGFRPAFIIIKAYNQVANWQMLDTARNPANAADKFFRANSNIAEATNYPVDILSNGFKLRNTDGDYNVSASYSYIFMAFSSNPFKTSLAR